MSIVFAFCNIHSTTFFRISPPGEFCTSSFREIPQKHTFPVCTVSNSTGLRVSVACPPRKLDNQLLQVPCKLHDRSSTSPPSSLQADQGATASCEEAAAPPGKGNRSMLAPLMVNTPTGHFRDIPQFVSPQRPHAGMVPPRHQQRGTSLAAPHTAPAHTRQQAMSGTGFQFTPDRQQSSAVRKLNLQGPDQPPDNTPNQRMQKSPSPETALKSCGPATYLPDDQQKCLDEYKKTGAIPKKFSQKRLSLEDHSFQMPKSDFGAGEQTPLVSPKVLFTKKSPGQAYFHKDDAKWFFEVAPNKSSPESDGSSPEIDKYLKNMRSKPDPLSPEEIQSYLASLSVKNRKREPSPLAKTPSPEYINPNSSAVRDLSTLLSGFGDETVEKQSVEVRDDLTNKCHLETRYNLKPGAETNVLSPTKVQPASTIVPTTDYGLPRQKSKDKPKKDHVSRKCSSESQSQPSKPKDQESQDSENQVIFKLGDDGDDEIQNSEVSSNGIEQTTLSMKATDYENGQSETNGSTNGVMLEDGHHQDNRYITNKQPKAKTFHKSVSESCIAGHHMLPGFNKASPLYKTLLRREIDNLNKQVSKLSCLV